MKKQRLFLLTIFLLASSIPALAQRRGNVWCFGDSALVDFNDTANILTGRSLVKSRGSCASICDTSGQLLFYAGYDNDLYAIGGPPSKNGEIFNRNHSTMTNGDSIVMLAWYREVVIVDNPVSQNMFYVFTTNVTLNNPKGLFYSVVDMNQNGGQGAVIQKNIQLLNFEMVDGLAAIKHGNGRDWWVIARKFDLGVGNADYYIYLVSPNGINGPTIQSIGTVNKTNLGRIGFNKAGNRMCFVNTQGLIELYDFNRCDGTLSNVNMILPQLSSSPYPAFWSSEFSPNDSLLYTQTIAIQSGDSSRLYQFNLNAPDIAASADTLWSTPFLITLDQLKRGPDDKIYMATNYTQVYPYSDTTYNYINMNLSVINSPDSLGSACDLQPFSFNLGGARCYAGLPNNPDYDLPALVGSPCDTLVSLSEVQLQPPTPNLYVYYSSDWLTAFINADKLTDSDYTLSVFDIQGKEIFRESGKTHPPYFTKNLNCTGFAKGMYVVNFSTGYISLVKKFEVY